MRVQRTKFNVQSTRLPFTFCSNFVSRSLQDQRSRFLLFLSSIVFSFSPLSFQPSCFSFPSFTLIFFCRGLTVSSSFVFADLVQLLPHPKGAVPEKRPPWVENRNPLEIHIDVKRLVCPWLNSSLHLPGFEAISMHVWPCMCSTVLLDSFFIGLSFAATSHLAVTRYGRPYAWCGFDKMVIVSCGDLGIFSGLEGALRNFQKKDVWVGFSGPMKRCLFI